MTVRGRALALAAGTVAGAFGGLFGVGGGIVLIPILTGWFRATQHQAHGTSLAVVGITALASLPLYALHGNVEWATAGVVGLASVFTARAGARLAARVPARNLRRGFAVFLLLVGARLLWDPSPARVAMVHGYAAIATDLGIGALVGLIAGFMGVGGGILAVPAFKLLFGMTQQLAQGTSLAVILVTAPAGTLENLRLRNVLLPMLPPLAVGAALGGLLASWVVQDVPRGALTRGFAVFQIANAAFLWWTAGRMKPAPAAAPAR